LYWGYHGCSADVGEAILRGVPMDRGGRIPRNRWADKIGTGGRITRQYAVEAGHRVFCTRTSDLVQRLQAARRDLVLEASLAKLDKFDLIILDEITYAHKDQAETGVLFELIARRYEYRSIAIAANQHFSGWNHIFPDKAMTVAAIDR
jgi:DNA replication protein DnaC